MQWLRALVFTMLVASGAVMQAQNCTQQGIFCISPGTSAGPTMPQLVFSATQSACSSAQGAVQMSWFAAYAGPKKPGGACKATTVGAFVSPIVHGNGNALIDWNDNVYAPYYGLDTFEGGDTYMSVFTSDYGEEYLGTSVILGQNPSISTVSQAMRGMAAPWWFGRALTQQSATSQFSRYTTGVNPRNYFPLFGPPDGFGIGQIDGANSQPWAVITDDTLWDWQNNLAEGVGLAISKQPIGYAYIAGQIALAAKNGYGPPATVQYGTCPSMSWAGTGAGGVGDAEWITSYNGGHFATFTPYPVFTPHQLLQPSGVDWQPPVFGGYSPGWTLRTVYINTLCNTIPQTY